ncbi:MAG: 3-oxoacyl-ACP synthase, partial [Proteobacteria bacterium]|nr:3-oxoacyl-ACP synthase [Pseudomonadota bacterium]
EVLETLLLRNGLTATDVDLIVPHQANVRILDAVRAKIGIPEDRWVLTLERYANTTSATIPTSLDIAREQGRLTPGARVVLCAVGGGFTWGATLLNWTA